MFRFSLILLGIVLLFIEKLYQPFTIKIQLIIFLSGIVLLGIPHGAADLLVESRNSFHEGKKFSIPVFFLKYVGRLLSFGVLMYFFPFAGILFFILFASYHFGETDLHQFKTDTIPGKLFVTSYGLLILLVILLNHTGEVKELLMAFPSTASNYSFIDWLGVHKEPILSFGGLLFFTSTFIYFSTNGAGQSDQGKFIFQFAILILIIYNLPLILGFSFYFIVWHSVLSLRNITAYLTRDGVSVLKIALQIFIYSTIAMVGIVLFGYAGVAFSNMNAMIIYILMGLAVLTAPHMQVMHSMYNLIRSYHGEKVKSVDLSVN